MTIYVVKSGDTLWNIARRSGVSVQSIIQVNGLEDIPHLVIGQALVIPSTEKSYRVQRGDSLWTIGRKFNVSAGSIAELNGIPYPYTIYPGTVLRIPEVQKNYGFIEVNAYIEPGTSDSSEAIVGEVGKYLTYISPFSYQVNANGDLKAINDSVIIRSGYRYRVAPLMVITNFENGNFNTDIAHAILSSLQIQDKLISNAAAIMKQKGYYGLNIDFERIRPEDRQLYNNFLRRVVEAMHRQNYSVSTALAPKSSDIQTGAWHGAHDYRAHGEIVDFVIIMTYEWGWSGGPPYAVAPIDLVKQVLDYAVSVIPRKKVMMGIPLYGYDWRLPYVAGGPWARQVSPVDAVNLAARYNTSILYDTKVQSPHFNYTDSSGVRHEVWFEDARSIEAKLRVASQYGLRGVSYWVLGLRFPQNWAVLDNMFNIVKVVR